MLVTRLHEFLTTPITERNQYRVSKFSVAFWFTLSLSFAAGYGLMALPQAFSAKYVVGDDAREYLFGMYRFFDPELFQHDLIADYFHSITPAGYAALYRLMAALGITPVLFSKLLPIVLGLMTTVYCFAVCMQILAVPIAGFIAALLLNQTIWMHDEIISAAPRGFLYALFLAFLYYLLKRSLLPCLGAIALQGLFYPPVAFISSGVLLLRLWKWQGGQLRRSQDRSDYLFCAIGLCVALLAMMPYILISSQFGPAITAAAARRMPEYWAGGRVSYFDHNLLSFWLDGRDSGVLPLMSPLQLFMGLLLPIILKYPSRFPLTKQVKNTVEVLPQVVLTSLGMFFAAHVLAFKLHFPSRYTHHYFKIVLALAAGIALTLMLDAAFRWSEQRVKLGFQRRFLTTFTVALVGAALVLYPSSLKVFPKTLYVVGGVPTLYQFLQQQPKDSLVASLSSEVDNLPTFAKRSILVGREYALPFHTKYYEQFRQRAIDLINAQYSPEIDQVKSFVHKYDVNFWLLDRTAFTPEYIADSWIKQYHPAMEAKTKLQQGTTPALSRLMKRCAVFETESLVVLHVNCIDQIPE